MYNVTTCSLAGVETIFFSNASEIDVTFKHQFENYISLKLIFSIKLFKKKTNVLLRKNFCFYLKTLDILQKTSCQRSQNYRNIFANSIIN